jgi:phosphocarrier protein HPr
MLTFDYVIKDKLGIHARPAGMLVKEAESYNSSITITNGDKSADVKKLLSLISLGVRYDDSITLTFEGEDEAAAHEALKQIVETNL